MNIKQLSIPALVATFLLPLAFGVAHAASGDADPSFGGAGYVRYAAPKTVPGLFAAALGSDDGSVVVAGGADAEVFVRRYRPDGALDSGFGSNGTTFVPGFNGGGRNPPALHLYPGSQGGILLEQLGSVRRLTSSGLLDPTYSPATLRVQGRSGYTLLPQKDGRFVVVAGQEAFTPTVRISVRFYLPDGKPDTVRGDANGELLLYPGGEGTYTDAPTHAVTDTNGKILIGARWDKSQQDTGLVLIRLNADGSYDNSFGLNGVVIIGSMLGRSVTSPQISVGRDGRIGYLFSVFPDQASDPYFVVYVLQPNGQQDTSAPSGGRISVITPRASGVPNDLRWLSGSPELAIFGATPSSAFGASNPPIKLMLWRANLAAGTVGTPEFSGAGLGTDFLFDRSVTATGAVLAGNGRLWAFGGEDNYIWGRLGASPLTGTGRGVLLPFDTSAFTTATPPRIVTTFSGRYLEAFGEAKLQSNGSILVLGSYNPVREQYPAATLTRFTDGGQLDSAYGNGTARVTFGAGDGSSNRLVPSPDDRAIVLKTLSFCIFSSCGFSASLWRFTAAGAADSTFGIGGSVSLTPNNEPIGTIISPGYVDDAGAVTLVRLADTIRPIRYTAAGVADPAFVATEQSAPASSAFNFQTTQATLDALPDGRLQAVAVLAGTQQMILRAYRWMHNGAVDVASTQNGTITIPAVDMSSYAAALDTLVLADGRTLVAIDQTSQRIVLRLRADGSLDSTFGSGGYARIDGVAIANGAKLVLESNGKILLTYNTRLGGGNALTVARFAPDGQRDPTFTADGRFDSLFSLSGNETASDLLALPDGRLLAVGQSDGHGLLLKLRGTSVQTAMQSAPVVEFFNTILGHYFISGGAGEIGSVDKGGAGPGWQRTGFGFRAYIPESGVPAGALPVCRFYGTPGRGPNSHFYTVRADECAQVKTDPGWTYEGTAFYLFAPVNGQCASAQQAVYRVYNNRFPQNDSNHRYTTDSRVYAQMQTQGWAAEGTVFCAPT